MNKEKIFRVYVEKKPGFDVEANGVKHDLISQLRLTNITGVRVILRYDVCGITTEVFEKACIDVFSEPNVDNVYFELPAEISEKNTVLKELLPGMYDRRADSAEQCIRMLAPNSYPTVKCASLFVIEGIIDCENMSMIKRYLINPVECREGSFGVPAHLEPETEVPGDVPYMEGFNAFNTAEMTGFLNEMGLAMSIDDAMFVQAYFKEKDREPTETEIRVIDTYWSDHCRHTTFLTRLDSVRFENDESNAMQSVWEEYMEARKEVYGEMSAVRPITLMDLATIAAKLLKKQGKLSQLDESEEVNACSIKVDAIVDGKPVPYLVMFKNETHNHPTEIESFGGAATCLGGAIRDPLSGRSYVYQAMRVTGSANPNKPYNETLKGKLPQRVITLGAANGYSSYGNQMGLATGLVSEIYHEGYEAKRMEIGAVIAAAPAENVIRERPQPGDAVLLLGGRTGRDGCGGATGSSKSHDEESLTACGAEVQKGNPITERKIQRLFRKKEAARIIKRCNDFGAGGVSVAVGELADGLDIDLELMPKKYEGLNGTETAISESQERMAVVVASKDVQRFTELAHEENLECSRIATVTEAPVLRMKWRDKYIVDIDRSFLDTNGAQAHSSAVLGSRLPSTDHESFESISAELVKRLSAIGGCCQRGLSERFDATVGAGTVLMPLGGITQTVPAQAMAARLPADGETCTGTIMAYGFDPYLSAHSPFHGAIAAVLESLARLACAGGDIKTAYLSFQEYFGKLGEKPERWGLPLAALLGAFLAQKRLNVAAIGGKDSMSGSFKDIDVPPTLVSFAVTASETSHIISGELKKAGSRLYLLKLRYDNSGLPDFNGFSLMCERLRVGIIQNSILAAHTVDADGVLTTIARMSFGNRLGVKFIDNTNSASLFAQMPCSIIVELAEGAKPELVFEGIDIDMLGTVQPDYKLNVSGESIDLHEAYKAYTSGLSGVFPTVAETEKHSVGAIAYNERNTVRPSIKIAKPKVLIPIFPGTNCEYESIRAFELAGAVVESVVIRNTKQGDIEDSLKRLENGLRGAQIVMLPGGFSAADEPDGSGKFISAVFKNSRISDAVHELLYLRDGLMLGICNGFQALIKLGLVPFGEIRSQTKCSPTLTYNSIGRHQSRVVRTRIASVKSPWFAHLNTGDVVCVPISCGEGRFVCPDVKLLDSLIDNGQIASQYVDEQGNPSMNEDFNPTGSMLAIEGITSPNGRVLGKMGHNERYLPGLLKNVPGNYDIGIFESGVKYFR